MMRLNLRSQTPQEAVLEIHGWVRGKHVSILEQEGSRLLGETQCLVLDLRGVQFIDEAGIALLQRWSGARLVLRGGSLFIRTLLDQHRLAHS